MIAYISSSPITHRESFTFNEVNEINRAGLKIVIFALRNTPKCGNELDKMTEYTNLFSWNTLKAHIGYLFRFPIRYFKTILGVLRTDSLKSFYIFIKSVPIAKRIKELNIIHIHSPWASSGATACWIISKLIHTPFSFTAHAWDLFCGGKILKEKMREASFIIAISDYNKKYIIDKFGIEYAPKIHVIHCGVDLNEFTLENKKPKRKNILSIATFTEKKGTEYLLRAIKLLKDNGNNFEVVISGVCTDRKEKQYKRKLESYIKENDLQDNISIIEKPDRKQIRSLMRESALFVLPSIIAENGDRDGIPVVLMEAMASGLPVVSTRVSGIPELVIDNESGILANPGNLVDLADKMLYLLADSALQNRLKENARKKIEEEFDVLKNSNLLRKLFMTSEKIMKV